MKIKNLNVEFVMVVGAAVLMAMLLINSFSVASLNSKLDARIIEAKELLKPAEIQVTKITQFDCFDCFDIEDALSNIKNQNVEITSEKTLLSDSQEAMRLLSRYSVQKLPTLIITGETNKTEKISEFFNSVGEIKDDVVVYTDISLPYYDKSLGRVIGRVELINIIDSGCEDCVSLSQFPDNLAQLGVAISNSKLVEYNSKEGKELINRFSVKQIPAILISEEIDYYDNVKQVLSQLNSSKKQGYYAIHSTIPPYRDLKENKIVGLVELIMLHDSSCIECYDVEVNKQILAKLGLKIKDEKKYDVSSEEGKKLISKYEVKKVPIIFVSPEAEVYDVFVKAWQQVGSVESDGWFVMRNPEVVGTIKEI